MLIPAGDSQTGNAPVKADILVNKPRQGVRPLPQHPAGKAGIQGYGVAPLLRHGRVGRHSFKGHRQALPVLRPLQARRGKRLLQALPLLPCQASCIEHRLGRVGHHIGGHPPGSAGHRAPGGDLPLQNQLHSTLFRVYNVIAVAVRGKSEGGQRLGLKIVLHILHPGLLRAAVNNPNPPPGPVPGHPGGEPGGGRHQPGGRGTAGRAVGHLRRLPGRHPGVRPVPLGPRQGEGPAGKGTRPRHGRHPLLRQHRRLPGGPRPRGVGHQLPPPGGVAIKQKGSTL